MLSYAGGNTPTSPRKEVADGTKGLVNQCTTTDASRNTVYPQRALSARVKPHQLAAHNRAGRRGGLSID